MAVKRTPVISATVPTAAPGWAKALHFAASAASACRRNPEEEL